MYDVKAVLVWRVGDFFFFLGFFCFFLCVISILPRMLLLFWSGMGVRRLLFFSFFSFFFFLLSPCFFLFVFFLFFLFG